MFTDKWNNYIINQAKFIEANRSDLFHQLYIDFVRKNPNIKSILEIGPGQLVEYPDIKKIRTFNYTVVEISKPFIEFIKSKYPEITIVESSIEDYDHLNTYDLVRVCDVIEHTFPVVTAIKKIICSAKRFHITMFKWHTGDGKLDSTIRIDSDGIEYYSTIFPITQILHEIEKYGTIESTSVVIKDDNTVVPFGEYWLDNNFSERPAQKSTRGHRLIITGTRNETPN